MKPGLLLTGHCDVGRHHTCARDYGTFTCRCSCHDKPVPTDPRPRLLDLFSCAGGAARGYQQAGFHVTGIDINEQPRYAGDVFVQGDALEYLAAHGHEYDAIHGSPPCQHYANVTKWRGSADNHPDMLDTTRQMFMASGLPWVIENVPEAPIRSDYLLCGSMFGLPVRRHRAFETSWRAYELHQLCQHSPDDLAFMHKGERAYADALGCGWMSAREGRQAIPPAYTRHVGEALMRVLSDARSVAS